MSPNNLKTLPENSTSVSVSVGLDIAKASLQLHRAGRRAVFANTAAGRALTSASLTTDIRVEVAAADERRFVEDPFYQPAGAGPGTRAARLTEADLVRMHREGLGGAGVRARQPEPTEGPRVTDPVLARALDLLKSLAILEAHV